MWRSFFYAVGIALFSMGLQALVIDHVLVPKDTRLQKTIKRILTDDKPASPKTTSAPPQLLAGRNPNQNQGWFNQTPQTRAGQQTPFQGVNTGSRFGPSRFAGSAYGTGYGGARVGANQPNRSGYGNFQDQRAVNAQFAGYRNDAPQPQTAVNKGVSLQKLLIREWMPWSLLASGAIIFLYTHTLHKRRSHE